MGSGPGSATLMVIGEAPGRKEDELKQCFVGPSGDLLDELLINAGSGLNKIYKTNVIKVRPPNNNLEQLHELGYKIEDFLPLLANEIQAIQPNCILAVGSLACQILTGKEGITKWRGSILPELITGIKTVPTIHPAALFDRNYGKESGQGMFSWKQKSHIQFDVIRAVKESLTPNWPENIKNIEIIKTSLQLQQFFNYYKDYKKVYVDTEVFKSLLVCIGFAFTRYHACSVPLIHLQANENHGGIPLHDLVEIWRIVAEVLANEQIEKAGQNFKADKVYWLENVEFEVNNFSDDGMFKMHTLSPELPKSLAFQTSIFTNQPYYKDEGKEYNPRKDHIDNLLKYNGMDCAVNCECIEEMDKDLKELGLEEFYNEFVMKLYPIYEDMEKRGWLIDKEKRKELSDHYAELIRLEEAKLAALLAMFDITYELNYDSPKQVSKCLYVDLRLPLRKDTKDQTLTGLMNNAIKNQQKKQIIDSILNCRSLNKLKTVYVDFKEDLDGRVRCTYNQVGTETGRTSTSIIKRPLRNGSWGVPSQTVPRPDEYGGRCREQFIADPGKILAEVDQSQAEARIVALLAKDYKLLRLFDIVDVHKLTASFCYGITSYPGPLLIDAALNQHDGIVKEGDTDWIDFSFLDQVIDEQRQIGKNTRHGCGYALGEEGLSIKMKISLYRAKQTMKKVHEMSPNIRDIFHEDIQTALANNGKVLMTPFGRRRELFNKWGNELFREAYAHIPQSTIADNTKRCMRDLLYEKGVLYNKKLNPNGWMELLQEGHDSFVMQIPPERQKDFYNIVKPVFEQPIDFSKCTLSREPVIIPTEFKFGLSWGSMKKYKGD